MTKRKSIKNVLNAICMLSILFLAQGVMAKGAGSYPMSSPSPLETLETFDTSSNEAQGIITFEYTPETGITGNGYVEYDLENNSIIVQNRASGNIISETLNRFNAISLISQSSAASQTGLDIGNGYLTIYSDKRNPENSPTTIRFTPKTVGNTIPEDVLSSAASRNKTIKFTIPYINGNSSALDLTFKIIVKKAPVDHFPGLTPPPGYVDPSQITETCYDLMGAVEFKSATRFKTEIVNKNTANRMYGFSIPLVGDLDGDGYPEIIGQGRTDGGVDLHTQTLRYVYIYSGQSGEILARLPFRHKANNAEMYFSTPGYHDVPSRMALIDSDRDGIVELVVAFSYYYATNHNSGGTNYINSLMSYELLPTKDGNGKTTAYTMREKWNAPAYYDTGAAVQIYSFAIPQVVDIEGKGNPSVIIQNKIFDAKTGIKQVEFGTLGASWTSGTTAYVGRDQGAQHSLDWQLSGFYHTYDVDFDGKYDLAAGGKLYYDIDLTAGTYKEMTVMDGATTAVPDGKTGVADVNGDGIPDIVSVTRGPIGYLTIYVWNTGLLIKNDITGEIEKTGTPNPTLIAKSYIQWNYAALGTSSHVYIGDIDGLTQTVGGKDYRLPEVTVLGGQITYSSIAQHPNIVGKDIPTTGTSSGTGSPAGVLAGFTWDATDGLSVAQRLKLSFVMGHNDRSGNTGFTMFDFDNDGMMEIVYRDEQTLRIIKAAKPFIGNNEADPNIVLFNEQTISFTGFEYPVIADIDNDASAEMVVIGRNQGVTDETYGFFHALGSGNDKFAPALSVWNQFIYDPFKINEDLTTPIGDAPNRLVHQYEFTRLVKDENGNIQEVVQKYNPYNGTLIQNANYMLMDGVESGSQKYDKVYEPLIFLTEAYILDDYQTNDEDKKPQIIIADEQIKFYIGNRSTARTDISITTPITVYQGSIENSTITPIKMTLQDLGVVQAVKAGNEVEVLFPVPSAWAYYIIRLGDDSDHSSAGNPIWRFGANSVDDLHNDYKGVGVSSRAYRDCDWYDQTVDVSVVSLNRDDDATLSFGSVNAYIFANDKLPTQHNAGAAYPSYADAIAAQPTAGTLKINAPDATSGGFSYFTYTHNNAVELANSIDEFTYRVSYYNEEAKAWDFATEKAYVFVVQPESGSFAGCYGEDYEVKLKPGPEGSTFIWFDENQQIIDAPGVITNLTSNKVFYVLPYITSTTSKYAGLTFDKVKIEIKVIGSSVGDIETLVWRGADDYSNWYNPVNWMWIDGTGTEVANSGLTPTGCTDVVIGTREDLVNQSWPMIKAHEKGLVNDITLKGKAQFKNSYLLTYNTVMHEVDLDPATEFGKWFLYYPAFTGTVAGDYIPLSAKGRNLAKLTYLNIYDDATKTFGKSHYEANTTLDRDDFMLMYIDAKDTGAPVDEAYSWRMPVSDQYPFYGGFYHGFYQPIGHTAPEFSTSIVYPVTPAQRASRKFVANASKFVFNVDATTDKYVLVANPYSTHLNLNKFLAEHATVLEADTYKVWNSEKADDFLTRAKVAVAGDEPLWKLGETPTMSTIPAGKTVYIPPYHVFYVKAKSAAGALTLTIDSDKMTEVLKDATASDRYTIGKEVIR